MRTASIIMLVLAIVFIIIKVVSVLALTFIPTSDNLLVYSFQSGQIALSTVLHLFIAIVLIQIKENPVRAISYFIYIILGVFSALMANVIVTYFNDKALMLWSIIGIVNIVLLINLVIQSHLIKNTALKPSYVLQAWSMLASTLMFSIYPYLAYNILHQQEPSKFPSYFHVLTEFVLVYLIFKIYQYFNSIDYQKHTLFKQNELTL